MPQSRQHATNGPCLAIWERMETEPQIELPHENSTCPSVSYPTSSFDGSQSPIFALQTGEELKGWLEQMAAQIPDADGLTAEEREKQQISRNEADLSV